MEVVSMRFPINFKMSNIFMFERMNGLSPCTSGRQRLMAVCHQSPDQTCLFSSTAVHQSLSHLTVFAGLVSSVDLLLEVKLCSCLSLSVVQ